MTTVSPPPHQLSSLARFAGQQAVLWFFFLLLVGVWVTLMVTIMMKCLGYSTLGMNGSGKAGGRGFSHTRAPHGWTAGHLEQWSMHSSAGVIRVRCSAGFWAVGVIVCVMFLIISFSPSSFFWVVLDYARKLEGVGFTTNLRCLFWSLLSGAVGFWLGFFTAGWMDGHLHLVRRDGDN
ncbi:hypothetical protein N658DRAFT_6313 [Parathielavia hyrcaniae]|uniref:Uncharacterized protein n=1 Tax=Parathielavia hyrcaniae TaxID=113614 RepID=A0AAN6Q9I6_9PEZI|nr:hypothetical protein N658DRAFT_6313 [Parathielavia hyrcaniae]